MIRRIRASYGRRSGADPPGGTAPCGVSGTGLALVVCLVVLTILTGVAGAQTAPGTQLLNTATGTYDAGGLTGLTALSNTHTLTVTVQSTIAELEFLRLAFGEIDARNVMIAGTAYSTSGTELGPFVTLPAPLILGGTTLNLLEPVATRPEDTFHQNDTVILRLTDPDQDLDHGLAETVLISFSVAMTAEREVLRLTETGPHTGIFTGHIQTVGGDTGTLGDGVLTVMAEAEILGRYQDPASGDIAEDDALVDPLSRIFASGTGGLLDGARLTLLNALTGQPATVLGDDGTSDFPSTIITGQPVTDAGGRVYEFPPGSYRYPWVSPGSYRLQILPPPGYLAPTEADLADLQQLPGAPWFLDEAASRGESFAVLGQAPLRLDVPLDLTGGDLYLVKRAAKTTVAPGEFLVWELTLANNGSGDASDLTIVDTLPRGVRLRPGTVRLGGAAVPDPEVSPDGRTLTFHFPLLPLGSSLAIRYLTGVDVAATRGTITSTALASHAGLSSNRATASVTIRDELFADRSVIIGRVAAWDCDSDSTDGVAGVRIYLEDGTGVTTDERGRFHFEDVRPGAHVVQMDTATLPPKYEAGSCDPDDHRAEHPFARMLDLQGGTMWRTDFAVHSRPPATGSATVELTTVLRGDELDGTVILEGEGVALRNRRLTVLLPDDTRYVPGSSRLDSAVLADPEDRGGALTWRLGDGPADWRHALTFQAQVDSTLRRRDLTTGALLTLDTPVADNVRTAPARAVVGLIPEVVRMPGREYVLHPRFGSLRADLEPADRAGLDSLAAELRRHHVVNLHITGHSDSRTIPAAMRHLFANNYELGQARAQAVADHLAARLDLSVDRLLVASRGPDEPVADNATAEGRGLNRRVIVQVWTEDLIHHLPDRPVHDRGESRVAVVGMPPGETWDILDRDAVDPDVMPVFDMAWLEHAEPGFALLWPPVDHLPAMPSFKAAVKHDATWRVSLTVNDQVVDDLNFNGIATNSAATLAVTRWAGVDLHEGDNLCVFTARDDQGRVMVERSRILHFSGPPVRVELVAEASDLVSGGRRPAEIAVRLTDRDGYPVRRGLIGEFSVDAPYEPERLRSEDRKAALGSLEEPRPTYTVGKDGIAHIRLEPTTISGEVLLRFPLNQRHEDIRAWLAPEDRDWILVGLAEGTTGWNAVAGNLENLAEDGHDEEFYAEGRLAFFARGRVKGRWLLTAAYDSRRDASDPDDTRLFGAVDPDALYTVYGDASVQTHDAASRDKLYLKLERDRFYALFGDFATGLTVTELSRYNRRLTGLKSSVRTGVLDLTAFAARSHQGYAREELRGDGTSGIYRLDRGDLLVNSEQVTIEVRDRYRSELVLSEQRLTRFLDYDIDFVNGTLVFRQPIYQRDENFNPVFIVVEYETWDDREPQLQAGGRVAAHLGGDRIEVGATVVHEGAHGTSGDLAGLDTRVDVTEHLEVRAELAGSETDLTGRHGAYRADAVHRSRNLEAKAWLRRQESGFGLGQQRFGEAGMLKYGADFDWRFRRSWSFGGRALHESNLLTSANRDLFETRLAWNEGPWAAHVGHRQAVDRFATAPEARSLQLKGGVSAALLRTRLRLNADHDQSLGGQNANSDYPTRTGLGAEYQVIPQAAVFTRGEVTRGVGQDTRSTRVGVRSTPWAGGEVATSLEQKYREGATRVYRNAGLKQIWHLNERWSVDGGLDHAQVDGPAPDRVNPGVPSAIGADEGYTAVALGATCRGRNWRWVQRAELRNASSEDKWGLDGSLFVEPTDALGLQAGARAQRVSGRGSERRIADWRLGLAWRPPDSAWSVLQRLDYKTEELTGADFALDNWRIVNNINVNWRSRPWLQIAGRYGLRFAREMYESERYDATTDLVGLEARWFFARHWDVGLQAATRNSWTFHVHDLSGGAAVGLNLMEDLWLSLGYNVVGFRDRDFTGGYTAQGPYLRFRFRFNQESKHEMLF